MLARLTVSCALRVYADFYRIPQKKLLVVVSPSVLVVVLVALESVLKCGIALGHDLSHVGVVGVQVGLGEEWAVDCLKGFPAILALAHAQPLLMLPVRDVVEADGFFDCWHHVVHHCENIKTQSRKTYKPFLTKLFTIDSE